AEDVSNVAMIISALNRPDRNIPTPANYRACKLLVRTAGLEPARGFPQGILSPLRLPFRHVRGADPQRAREADPQRVRAADVVAPAALMSEAARSQGSGISTMSAPGRRPHSLKTCPQSLSQ